MLTRKEAKEKIGAYIKNNKPVKTGIKLPIRPNTTFNVYAIPVDYLVPNVLNDRIAWKIREFEAENKRELSVENEEDVNFVFKMIEDEHPESNENTLKDIARNGQQEHGVITNDGIIIDGNRRATLIRKLFQGEASKFGKNVEEFRLFETVVLSEDVEQDEIMALETSIQIGKDEKVDYNPINIYIKIDNFLRKGVSVEKIANYMSKTPSEIKNKIEIFKLMNDYLESIEKPNHYTLLDGLEDQFIKCASIFPKLDNKTYNADWNYDENDVTDFKMTAYDLMRAKVEGKQFRDNFLGKPNKTDGVFIKKNLWDDFYKKHQEIIESTTLNNEEDWKSLKNQFTGNIKRINSLLSDFHDEKSITSIINLMELKLNNLEELLKNKDVLSNEDIDKLHNIEKRIYRIRNNYE